MWIERCEKDLTCEIAEPLPCKHCFNAIILLHSNQKTIMNSHQFTQKVKLQRRSLPGRPESVNKYTCLTIGAVGNHTPRDFLAESCFAYISCKSVYHLHVLRHEN